MKTTYKPYEIVAVGDVQVHDKPVLDEKEEHNIIQHNKREKKRDKQEGIDRKDILTEKRTKPVEKEEEYIVEKILDKQKGTNGKMLYLIKWLGYPDSQNTWQSYSDIKNTQAYKDFLANKK